MSNRKRRKYQTMDDLELLSEFRKRNDGLIIGEFYRRYGHLVFGTAYKYLKNRPNAEDLTMHVFEKLGERIHNHSIQSFKSWLYMVTKNECLMILRKKGGLTVQLENELIAEDTLSAKISEELKMEALESALETLRDEQKTCIQLFYFEAKSYQEIAELVGLDIKKVKSAIQNGKRNLKINLETKDGFKSVK